MSYDDDMMTIRASDARAVREAHAEDKRAEIQRTYERHTALYIWFLVLAWIAGTCLAFIVQ